MAAFAARTKATNFNHEYVTTVTNESQGSLRD